MKNTTKLFLPLVLLIVLSFEANAQTNVSGGIYSNTTWTLANSPYIVTDTVVVFPGVTLTIEPGVVVKFENDIRLEIREAKLIANGTATDSITFTSNSLTPTPGIYDGIYLNGGNLLSSFAFCNFKYASDVISTGGNINTSYVLSVKNSSIISNINAFWCSVNLIADSCIFMNNDVCIYTVCTASYCHVKNNINGIFAINDINGYSTVTNCVIDSNQTGISSGNIVSHCIVRYNQTGINFAGMVDSCEIKYNQTGVYMDGGPGTIQNCIVDSNITVGVESYGSGNRANNIINCLIRYNGLGINDSDCIGSIINRNIIENNLTGIKLNTYQDIISCNYFCNNTSYDMYYNTSGNAAISNNYWCTTDSAIIESHIYDGYDDISLGLVNFMPIDTLQCYLASGEIPIPEPENIQINIFPNPVPDYLNVEIPGNYFNAELQIFNILGEEKYCSSIKNQNTIINVSNFAKGVYIIEVNSVKKISRQKFIKQ